MIQNFGYRKRLEHACIDDQVFHDRQFVPNVLKFLILAIIYRALGIPTEMFTVMFALGKTFPGWIAQWKEMRENNEPIGRPDSLGSVLMGVIMFHE